MYYMYIVLVLISVYLQEKVYAKVQGSLAGIIFDEHSAWFEPALRIRFTSRVTREFEREKSIFALSVR